MFCQKRKREEYDIVPKFTIGELVTYISPNIEDSIEIVMVHRIYYNIDEEIYYIIKLFSKTFKN